MLPAGHAGNTGVEDIWTPNTTVNAGNIPKSTTTHTVNINVKALSVRRYAACRKQLLFRSN